MRAISLVHRWLILLATLLTALAITAGPARASAPVASTAPSAAAVSVAQPPASDVLPPNGNWKALGPYQNLPG